MATIVFDADASTLTLNGYVFNNLLAGDTFELAPVNELTSHINSANGGVSIQKRTDGDVHDLTIRPQRASSDDVFLNSQINKASPQVFSGSIKQVFVRDGQQGVETWTLENGSITQRPTSVSNDTEGNSASEYKMRFRTAVRSM